MSGARLSGARRSGAARAYCRALAPAALALSFQGGFAAAVMALDRGNRGLPSNLGYLVAVEAAAALAFLGSLAAALARLRRDAAAAAASPLDSETPPSRLPGGIDAPWSELVEATKAASRARIAEREARSRADLDGFLESVHALKTPVTALSLMAERAEATGEAMGAQAARLEIDEMARQLDRAMARLRLADFEKGSRIRGLDAAELARASLRRHRRLFIARAVAAEVAGGFEAESDPDWLSFILDQLVSNAAKHAASRVRIEISTVGGRAPKGRIDVADDGPGFTAEEAARAFGRSAAGGERAGGSAVAGAAAGPAASGYGLYLAREAALRLGAALAIVPGEGGRLRLELGLAPGPFGDITRM
jgi:signal transduction histidine kinase